MRIFRTLFILGISLTTIWAQAPADWNINAHDYEHAMTVTAVLEINGISTAAENDLVAAFHGTECRGVVSATQVGDEMVFFLLIYSDSANTDLDFKFWNAEFGNIIALDQTLNFIIGGGIGEVDQPYILTGENLITSIHAVDDSVVQTEDDTLSPAIDVLNNDTFNDTLATHVYVSKFPEYGDAIESAHNTFRYIPNGNFFGQDSFQYEVWNDYGKDSAWVFLEITGTNDKPVAHAGSDLVTLTGSDIYFDGTGSYDIDGDALSYEWQGVYNNTSFWIETSANPIVHIPQVSITTTIPVRLQVFDGNLYSDWDTVYVQINAISNVTSTNFDDMPQTSGEPITLEIEFPAYFSPISAILFYQAGGNSDQDSTVMYTVPSPAILRKAISGSGTWRADIPGESVTDLGLSYYAEAIDSSGNTVTTDVRSIPVEVSSTAYSMSQMAGSAYPDGVSENKWRLISIPTVQDQHDIKSFFDVPLGQSAGEQSWQLYDWDGEHWQVPDSIGIGRGYWFQHRLNGAVDLAIGAGTSADLSGISLPMQPGWNLFSSPYNFPISASVDSIKFSGFYAYGDSEGEGWSSQVDTLQPWAAYAAYNWADSIVQLELTPQSQALALGKPVAPVSDWKFHIGASNGKLSDLDNHIGRSLVASSARDACDQAEPPNWGNYLSVCIKNPDLDKKIINYASDIRYADDSVESWYLQLTAGQSIRDVTLMFSIEGKMPIGHVNVIVDILERKWFELGEHHLLDDISLGIDFSRKYEILSGPENLVYKKVVDLIESLPEQNTLAANYPNPFNGNTLIGYTLRDQSSVRLDVYDIRGRHVRTLVNTVQNMGEHTLSWSGFNDDGEALSSGIYLYRLLVISDDGKHAFQTTRKMVLVQ